MWKTTTNGDSCLWTTTVCANSYIEVVDRCLLFKSNNSKILKVSLHTLNFYIPN